jgi:hypothetical protein
MSSTKSKLGALFAPRREIGVSIWAWNNLPVGVPFPSEMNVTRTAQWVARIPKGVPPPFDIRQGQYLPWLGDVVGRWTGNDGAVTLVVM